MKRFFKQFIYGAFFLSIWFVIGFLFWQTFLRPAPSCTNNYKDSGEEGIDCGGSCAPCALQTLKPLKSSGVEIVYGDGYKSAVFDVINPNLDWGAQSFLYEVDFLNPDNSLAGSVSGESFIYPGEVKKLVNFGIKFETKNIIKTEVKFSDFSWKNISGFYSPKTSMREVNYDFNEVAKKIKISGILTNNEFSNISKSEILVTIENNLGILSGASQTSIDNIPQFEEREFLIMIPVLDFKNIDRDSIRISVSSKR
ncbi:MAG: hypothetical protein EXS49_00325 [Candidatus Pacebacteria bacterium]|nr:hypothetical protein [Candidatus Paceibacterota bacterium]